MTKVSPQSPNFLSARLLNRVCWSALPGLNHDDWLIRKINPQELRRNRSRLRLSLQINLTFLSLKMDFSFVIEEPEHESRGGFPGSCTSQTCSVTIGFKLGASTRPNMLISLKAFSSDPSSTTWTVPQALSANLLDSTSQNTVR